jgi:hypothetical protein
MKCAHDQYRSVLTSYDQGRGTLVYFWRCDRCGAHLGEYERVQYRPQYEMPARAALGGNERPMNGS